MPDGPTSAAAAITELGSELAAAGIETAIIDARLLVLAAAGLERLDLVREPGLKLSEAAWRRLAGMRARRLDREPVSRILGRREFWSLDLEVTPAVLDPRPDTETLVEATLDHVRQSGRDRQPMRVLDLGTGSGAVLLALLSELPMAFGVGVDCSSAALEVARRNADRTGVGNRTALLCASWTSAIEGPIDIIVANPPYLASAEIRETEPEVARFDPWGALDGGADGLDAYRAIVAGWQRLGRPAMFLETGASQAGLVIELIKEYACDSSDFHIEHRLDLAGRERVVAALPQFGFPG
jgi:release factor glutamine methyltransferase